MNLDSSVSNVPFIGPTYVKRLEKLGIYTIHDLLWHVPFRYDDLREVSKITDFPIGEIRTIKAEIIGFKNQYTKQGKVMQIAEVYDGTGKISCIWFNQRFLSRTLPIGTMVYFAGELSWWKKSKAIYSPDFEIYNENKPSLHTGRLVPIYHETYGISSKWLRARLFDLINRIDEADIPETLTSEILEKYKLMSLYTAIKSIHFPNTPVEAMSARKRLSLDELLVLQIQSNFNKIEWSKNEIAKQLQIDRVKLGHFISSLPFKLTGAQAKAVEEIITDFEKPTPMNRLLEGDVGSGKTVVAAAGAYIAHLNKQKSVIMAPTQILAQQHYQTLIKLFEPHDVGISLSTSTDKIKNKDKVDIFVGTHSLLHDKIDFSQVGFVVIDEQHRFGVEQRTHLISKSHNKTLAPHVLTMTATPIPRTIALTMYGELELSVLDELPQGRIPITTWVVPPEKRTGAYEWITKQIEQYDSQVFVVCPLIEESESETLSEVKSAKSEYEKLKTILKNQKIGLLHGKLKANEKTKILQDFRDKKFDVLVTTPVVEVGVDIPSATIMMIETADRFGLASLHQLRGRVGRGNKKSYCLLMTESTEPELLTRLQAMTKTTSGFELAEVDLKLRGPGEILGTAQHGFGNLKIASWSDFDLIKLSREISIEIVENQQNFGKLLDSLKKLTNN